MPPNRRLVPLVLLLAASSSCGASSSSGAEITVAQPEPDPSQPDEEPGGPAAELPEASPDDVQAFGRASNAFAIDLWERVRQQDAGNVVVSPASISMALAMTYAGARAQTAEQMAAVLHVDGFEGDGLHAAAGNLLAEWNDPDRESYRLAVANRLFGETTYDFEGDYLALGRDRYRAPLEPVDYRGDPEGARARINGWVAEQTEDRIRDLLPPGSIDEDTRLVLTNAVYFLGEWADPFETAATRAETFDVAPGRSVTVPTMHQTAHFDYTETDSLQALQMRYEGGEVAMLLLLPRDEAGLEALEGRLSADAIDGWVDALQSRRVAVSMPKVEIDPPQPLQLSETLRQMGMTDAFDRARADFTGIADPPRPADRLFLSEVFHEAFVAIDEEGTEAAAATAVVMPRATSAMPREEPVAFEADHPFLFLIRDLRSGTILFLGRVHDPS